jgi:cobalt-zinc-cadmium efflux system membrane fusion protein
MMFARFRIVTGEARETPAAPASAVIYEGDAARVWVAEQSGTLAARAIRVGQIDDGKVQVLSGLAAGENVVTSGSLFIDRAARGD